jgi:hypothetical protein
MVFDTLNVRREGAVLFAEISASPIWLSVRQAAGELR